MKVSSFLILIIAFIVLPLTVCSNSFAENNEQGVRNVLYKKQATIACNKQEFRIPPYFPNGDKFSYNNKPPASNLYMISNDNVCNNNNLSVGINLGDDCSGQSDCAVADFSYGNTSDKAWTYIKTVFSTYFKEIKLDKNLMGYFVPAKCYASCNMAQLFWFTEDKVFVLSTMIANDEIALKELIKSANSYINNQE